MLSNKKVFITGAPEVLVLLFVTNFSEKFTLILTSSSDEKINSLKKIWK